MPYAKKRPPLEFFRRPVEFSREDSPEPIQRTADNAAFISAAVAQHEFLLQVRCAVIPKPHSSVNDWLKKVAPPLSKHRWQELFAGTVWLRLDDIAQVMTLVDGDILLPALRKWTIAATQQLDSRGVDEGPRRFAPGLSRNISEYAAGLAQQRGAAPAVEVFAYPGPPDAIGYPDGPLVVQAVPAALEDWGRGIGVGVLGWVERGDETFAAVLDLQLVGEHLEYGVQLLPLHTRPRLQELETLTDRREVHRGREGAAGC